METRPDSKTAVIKSLAIVGFFATVALLVWFVVQGLRAAPGSFASLASIMETINSYRPNADFTADTEKSIVNSGETFTLSWTKMASKGEYLVSYLCADGVSVTVRNARGTLESVACDDEFSVKDATELSMSITSASERFYDVPLIVAYEPKGDDRTEAEVRVTVVNATIPSQPTLTTTAPTSGVPEVPTPSSQPAAITRVTETAPVPTTKPTTGTTPVREETQTVTQRVSYMPVSYPNGYTDLKMSFFSMGSYTNNVFVPVGKYDNDVRSALKVEVKNIGTKTSESWTFTVTLPDGTTYTSEKQEGLRPNEKAVFTLGFDFDPGFTAKSTSVKGSVSVKNDTNSNNNSFTWAVIVID